eukprot:scaffold9353_cov71-Skeletonema_dohrnii-CCMP3373.AAC.2
MCRIVHTKSKHHTAACRWSGADFVHVILSHGGNDSLSVLQFPGVEIGFSPRPPQAKQAVFVHGRWPFQNSAQPVITSMDFEESLRVQRS